MYEPRWPIKSSALRQSTTTRCNFNQTINNNQVHSVKHQIFHLSILIQSPEWNWEASLMIDSSSPRHILIEVSISVLLDNDYFLLGF